MEPSRTHLTQLANAALQETVAFNRSGLPPFRLPQVAQQLVSGLEAFSQQPAHQTAVALGQKLAQQGLAMQSLQAVRRTLLRELWQRKTDVAEQEGFARLDGYFTSVLEGLVSHEIAAVTHQRDEMQAALARALQSREAELRQVIAELSTPIMPVFDQILVLPLVGAIDVDRSQKICERLLNEVVQRRARIIIIDITGVPAIDQVVVAALLQTARAVHLLGATAVLVGISPDLARVLAQSRVELGGLVTLANLQGGIEWALRRQQLTLQRLPRTHNGPQVALPPSANPAAAPPIAEQSNRSPEYGD